MRLQSSTRIYAATTCTCSVNCKPAGLSTISLETVSLKNQYYTAQVCPTSLNQRLKPVIPMLRNDPTLSASSNLKKNTPPHTHSDVSAKNRCVRVLIIFPPAFSFWEFKLKKSLFLSTTIMQKLKTQSKSLNSFEQSKPSEAAGEV